MNQTLSLGYSPCPNDTYIFYGLTHGMVRVPGMEFQERLEDVETLNQLALEKQLDITKVSYAAVGRLRENYALLRSGGALGRGCGPLIVARPGTSLSELRRGFIAVPGIFTTAYLLLKLFDPAIRNIKVMTYDRIMQAAASGEVTAGLIIHESRFTYPLYGLEKLLDLGEWWEKQTGLPIPLGGILAKRRLGGEILLKLEAAIRESVLYARSHEAEVMEYCKKHSQEMDESVMRSHIDLYVNDFTIGLGEEGIRAVRRLFSEAETAGIFRHSDKPLLAEENKDFV